MRLLALLLALFATASLSLGQAPCCVLETGCCGKPAAKAPSCPHCAKKEPQEKPAPHKCGCSLKSTHLNTSAEPDRLPDALVHGGAAPVLIPALLHRAAAPCLTEFPTGPPRPLSIPLLV